MSASECEHDWKPIPGWTGRYRCRKCWALGGRRCVKYDGAKRGTSIEPYVCTVRGCAEPAIAYDRSEASLHDHRMGRGSGQLCKRHREERYR